MKSTVVLATTLALSFVTVGCGPATAEPEVLKPLHDKEEPRVPEQAAAPEATSQPTASTPAPRPARDSDAIAVIQARLLAGLKPDSAFRELYSELPVHLAVRLKRHEDLQALAKAGADLDQETTGHDTPLLLAVGEKDVDSMAILLDGGAKADPPPGVKATSTHLAVMTGADLALTVLLTYGASPDRADATGQTPLHLAVIFDKPKLLDLLLQFRADRTRKDARGKTAGDHAKEMGHETMARKLGLTPKQPATEDEQRQMLGKFKEFQGLAKKMGLKPGSAPTP